MRAWSGFLACCALERADSASESSAPGASSASLTIRSVLTTSTTTLPTDDGRITALPSRSLPTRGVVMTRTRNVPSCSHGMSICLRSPANRSATQRREAPSVVISADTGNSWRLIRFASRFDSFSA